MVLGAILAYNLFVGRAAKKDIEKNGWDDSVTRKVFRFSSPGNFLLDAAQQDIGENGYKDSTTRKVLKYSSLSGYILDSIFCKD